MFNLRRKSLKVPDGLLEVEDRVYVANSSFCRSRIDGDQYENFAKDVVGYLVSKSPNTSFMVLNFGEDKPKSALTECLKEHEKVTVWNYPSQHEGHPLLPFETLHIILHSADGFLENLGPDSSIVMLSDREGWVFVSFMVAALIMYRKTNVGDAEKTLEMVHKKAPSMGSAIKDLFQAFNPLGSHIRYLEYIGVRHENFCCKWPPDEEARILDCVILRGVPNWDGEGCCRPLVRVRCQDWSNNKYISSTPHMLSTPNGSKDFRYYKQGEETAIKLNAYCVVKGDVVIECVNVGRSHKEETIFRAVINTRFTSSTNILVLNQSNIDTAWETNNVFPSGFNVEVLFSDVEEFNPVNISQEKVCQLFSLMNMMVDHMASNGGSPTLSPLPSLVGVFGDPPSWSPSSPTISTALPSLNLENCFPASGVLSPRCFQSPSPPFPPIQPPTNDKPLSPLSPNFIQSSFISPPSYGKASSGDALSLPPSPSTPLCVAKDPPPSTHPSAYRSDEATSSAGKAPPLSLPPPSQPPIAATVIPTHGKPPPPPPPPPPPCGVTARSANACPTTGKAPSPPSPPHAATSADISSTCGRLTPPPPPPSPPRATPPPGPGKAPLPPPAPRSSPPPPFTLPPSSCKAPPPPPPPPLSFSRAPRPPPLTIPQGGGGGGGGGRVSSTPSSQTPSPTTAAKPLKPYHWSKVPDRYMQGSLWADAETHDEVVRSTTIDREELEDLFHIAPINAKRGRRNSDGISEVPQKIPLIDMKRSYNCEIVLKKVKTPICDLMNVVLALDDSALNTEQVENLVKYCPTSEEIEKLKGFDTEKHFMGNCEKLFLEMSKIPRIQCKLKAFLFKLKFATEVYDIKEKLNIIRLAIKEVRESCKLRKVLHVVLSIGNEVNQGTARGCAKGFKLESLLKLVDIRASSHEMNLLHYLCKNLDKHLPMLLDFYEELPHLEEATKIETKTLTEDLQGLINGFSKVERELAMSQNDGAISQRFRKVLKEFLDNARDDMNFLSSLHSKVIYGANSLYNFFHGNDPTTISFEHVISTLHQFVVQYKRALSEYHEIMKRKKIEAKEVPKENRRISFNPRY